MTNTRAYMQERRRRGSCCCWKKEFDGKADWRMLFFGEHHVKRMSELSRMGKKWLIWEWMLWRGIGLEVLLALILRDLFKIKNLESKFA